MMIVSVIMSVFNASMWIIMMIVLSAIIKYLKSKPLGRQTVLSLVSIDTGYIIMTWHTCWSMIQLVSIWLEDPGWMPSVILVLLGHVTALSLLSSLLTTSTVRAALILGGAHVFDVIRDDEAKLYGRGVILALMIMAGLMDQITGNTNNFLMDMLQNGTHVESPVTPGFGGLILAVSTTLVIGYCQYKVRKKDKEFGEVKSNWQLNIGSIAMANFTLLTTFIILQHFVGQDSIVFMHVQLSMTTIFLGLFLPVMIILGNDNMKNQIWNRHFGWIKKHGNTIKPSDFLV